MDIFFKLNQFLNKHTVVTALLLILISAVFFGYLNYSHYFPDADGYYHLKMAEIYADRGIIKSFPYLQFTIMKDHFTDHQFLYHLILVPFIKIFSPLAGIKIAHTIFAVLLILVFYFLLKKLKVNGAFWYCLFLFLNNLFIFRIFLIKPQPLVLIIIFLSLYFIFSKNIWSLFILSFIYVWTYAGWGLLPLLAILYLSIEEILKKEFFDLQDLKLIGVIFTGLALGIITHPHFPQNLYFYYVQSIILPFFSPANLSVPLEWLPFSAADFISAAYLPILFCSPAVIIFFYYRRFYAKEIFFFICSTIFFVLMIKSKRHVEYLIPCLTIFSAIIYSSLGSIKKLKQDLAPVLNNKNYPRLKNLFGILILAVLLIIIPVYAKNIKDGDKNNDVNYFKKSAEFLSANSAPGDIVFHTNFDDFPPLFLHNDKNYYITGLAPIFTYIYDQGAYDYLEAMKVGKIGDVYGIIKNKFKAKYVIAPKNRVVFFELCKKDRNLEEVYSDEESTIYKIN